MSKVQLNAFISIQAYLDAEKGARTRHEYVGGQVYAMVGASKPHNRIAGAFYSALRAHLAPSRCDVFMSDMKVRVGEAFYYPDVLVDCQSSDKELYYTQTPILIIEVVSASTRPIDEREKRIAYQSLSSLKEYVLAEQDRCELKVYRRLDQTNWLLEVYGEGDSIQLSSIQLTLPMRSLYEGAWR